MSERRPEDQQGKPKSPRLGKNDLRRTWRVFEYRRPVPVRPRFTT
jgi:hypothetical protein